MQDEERLVTLKEALAFIDSFDTTELSDSSSTTANDINDSPPSSSQTHNLRTPKRKRLRSTLSSSTRLQQRRKAELLYLRKYAQELEDKRVKLETWYKHFSQVELDAAEDSVWRNMAKTHFQARLRSETANRTLKTMLTSQTQVIDLLQNILHTQAFELEMDQASLVEVSDNVAFCTEIDGINSSLKGCSVACSQYIDTNMPPV